MNSAEYAAAVEEEQRIWREFGPAAMSKYGECLTCHELCEIYAKGICFDCTYLEIHNHKPFDPDWLERTVKFIRAARRIRETHTAEYTAAMKELEALYNCETCIKSHGPHYSLPRKK